MIRMVAFRVGTCGYDYLDWVGEERFYPPSVASNRPDMLTFYASQFSILELDFTHYGETSPKQLESMLKRVHTAKTIYLIDGSFTPKEDFQFSIKAYRSLTHEIDETYPASAKKFISDISPLRESGRLCAVLFQFPPSFRPTQESLDYLKRLHELFREIPIVYEFRYKRWFSGEVVDLLSELSCAFCWVDAPKTAGVPRHFFPLTADFAYARFHGRNELDWWRGSDEAGTSRSARYHYLYPEKEIEELARAIVETGAKRGYILFNNHPVADAPKNARQMEITLERLLSEKS